MTTVSFWEYFCTVLGALANAAAIAATFKSNEPTQLNTFISSNQTFQTFNHVTETHYHFEQSSAPQPGNSNSSLTFCLFVPAIILYYHYQNYIVLFSLLLTSFSSAIVFFTLRRKSALSCGRTYFISALVLLCAVFSLKHPIFCPDILQSNNRVSFHAAISQGNFSIASWRMLIFPLLQLFSVVATAWQNALACSYVLTNRHYKFSSTSFLFFAIFIFFCSSGLFYYLSV